MTFDMAVQGRTKTLRNVLGDGGGAMDAVHW